jgi:hypothetical protein
MARKRTLDRRNLRDQAEAAESREKDDDEQEEEAAADDEAGDEDAGDDDGEAKPKAKKKAPAKKKPAAAPKTTKRTRVPKEVRMKAVWVVFDNASKRVDTFPYSQKSDAEALLARKQEEKKGTFYISLVKEPME